MNEKFELIIREVKAELSYYKHGFIRVSEELPKLGVMLINPGDKRVMLTPEAFRELFKEEATEQLTSEHDAAEIRVGAFVFYCLINKENL